MAGQRGRPHGSTGAKLWRDALIRAVRQRAAGQPHALDRVATALVGAAMEGDVSAIKELGDRLDGRPAQSLQTDEGAPLKLVVSWER